ICVKLMVVIAVFFLDPAGQCGGLIVDEDTAIFDPRFVVETCIGFHEKLGVFLSRHVSPEIPGRNTDLFRQIVDAIDRSAFVAARDDQGSFYAGKRIADHLNTKRLPMSLYRVNVELPCSHKLVYPSILAERSYDHNVGTLGRSIWLQSRLNSCY